MATSWTETHSIELPLSWTLVFLQFRTSTFLEDHAVFTRECALRAEWGTGVGLSLVGRLWSVAGAGIRRIYLNEKIPQTIAH